MFEDILNFFKGKRSEQKNSHSKRAPFIIAVCVLAIIIPTVFAIFYAYFYDDQASLKSTTIEIELYDDSDSLLFDQEVSETDISNSPMIEAFYGMLVNKKSVSSPIEEGATPNFKFTVTVSGAPEKYNCYFKEKYSNSYISDEKGTFFSVDEKYYNIFLNSEFSEAAYAEATPPTLITGNGESILATSVTWNYQKQNGDVVATNNCITSDEITTYKIGGGINLNFAIEPDSCYAEIYSLNGSVLFSGLSSDLPFVAIETGEAVEVKLKATWARKEGSNYFGQLNYHFNVILTNKAEFFISSSTAAPAEFIIISAKNIDDISKIVYTPKAIDSETDLSRLAVIDENADKAAISTLYSYVPIFVSDGEYTRAMLPFPPALPSGQFSFTLSIGATNQSFTVNVAKSYEGNTVTLAKDSSAISLATSADSLRTFEGILASITPPNQNMIFYRGAFATPEDHGFVKGYSYADNIVSSDELTAFTVKGNEYTAISSGGQSVRTLNIGIVVATGYCEHLGNYVAIDHGMGLRTWYCGLSAIDVRIGDILSKNEQIGKSGEQALLSESGVLLICTVYDNVINPNTILGKEIAYALQ